MNHETNKWECKENKKKWKLLQEPHANFKGKNIRAMMKFERSSNGKLALVASQGNLLVDTGACTSVCSPNVFNGEVDHTHKEELYSVDDSPLKACGQIRPKLRLGEEVTEDATVTFQVVEGISENILSVNRAVDEGAGVWFSADECYILWPDGGKATFSRQGKQFILPFEELSGKHRQTQIAHINEDDEDAQAVRDYEMQHDEEAERQAQERKQEDPGLLGDLEDEAQPISPTWEEKQSHCLTYVWQQKQKKTSAPVIRRKTKKTQG